MRWKFSFQRTFGIFLIVLSITVVTVVVNTNYESKKTMNNLLELSNTSKNKTKDNEEDLGDYQGILEDQKVETPKGVSQIAIPKLDILAPIVEGTDSYSLSVSAGHFKNTAKMGGRGNYCIAGHSSSIYNCIFNNIHDINILEPMYFTNSDGKTFIYYVTEKFVVEPTEVDVLNQGTSDKICTIVTCTDNGQRRFIIRGKILSKKKLEELRNSLGLNLDEKYLEKLDEIGYIQFDYRMFDDNLGDDVVWHTFGIKEPEVIQFSQTNMQMLSCLDIENIKCHTPKGNEPEEYVVYRQQHITNEFLKQPNLDIGFKKSIGVPKTYRQKSSEDYFNLEEEILNVRKGNSDNSTDNNWFSFSDNIQKGNTKNSNNISMPSWTSDLCKRTSTRQSKNGR